MIQRARNFCLRPINSQMAAKAMMLDRFEPMQIDLFGTSEIDDRVATCRMPLGPGSLSPRLARMKLGCATNAWWTQASTR
jgi:hypothetical protein